MAQTVVDHLEAVTVDEKQSEACFAPVAIGFYDVLQPPQEMRAIR